MCRLLTKDSFWDHRYVMLMGELFFGAVMSIFILRWNALRGAIVIYPGIPMISYYLGSSLPVKWSNLLPGNWLMAARSNLVSKGWIFDGGCVICGIAVVRDMQLSIGQYAARIWEKMK